MEPTPTNPVSSSPVAEVSQAVSDGLYTEANMKEAFAQGFAVLRRGFPPFTRRERPRLLRHQLLPQELLRGCRRRGQIFLRGVGDALYRRLVALLTSGLPPCSVDSDSAFRAVAVCIADDAALDALTDPLGQEADMFEDEVPGLGIPVVTDFPQALGNVVEALTTIHAVEPVQALVLARSFVMALADPDDAHHHRAILTAALRGDMDQTSAECTRYVEKILAEGEE